MKRLLSALLLSLMPSLAWAQAAVTNYPAPWAPVGNTVTLAVSSTSSNVQMGWVAVSPTPPPTTAFVCNTGAVNAYVLVGGISVVVTAGTGTLVAAGVCLPLAVQGQPYLAGITSSSTTSLSIQTGLGSPMTGIPGGGGGAPTPIPNNTVLGNTSGGAAFPTAQVSPVVTTLTVGTITQSDNGNGSIALPANKYFMTQGTGGFAVGGDSTGVLLTSDAPNTAIFTGKEVGGAYPDTNLIVQPSALTYKAVLGANAQSGANEERFIIQADPATGYTISQVITGAGTYLPIYINGGVTLAQTIGIDGSTTLSKPTISGGSLIFSNVTSNTSWYGAAGSAVPGAASVGEKMQLFGTAGTAAASDYAIGIESSNMWFNTGPAGGFRWYQNASPKMSFDGAALAPSVNNTLTLGTASFLWSAAYFGAVSVGAVAGQVNLGTAVAMMGKNGLGGL